MMTTQAGDGSMGVAVKEGFTALVFIIIAIVRAW